MDISFSKSALEIIRKIKNKEKLSYYLIEKIIAKYEVERKETINKGLANILSIVDICDRHFAICWIRYQNINKYKQPYEVIPKTEIIETIRWVKKE